MQLIIQTNISGQLNIWLKHGQKIFHRYSRTTWHSAEAVLPMIDHLLHQAHRTVKHISSIHVVRGPGPFTAVRSGILVANTLGWMLNIPVSARVTDSVLTEDVVRKLSLPQLKTFRAVRPSYGRAPNITKPKPQG